MPYADLDNLIADYIPEAKSQREKDAVGRILMSVSAFVDSYTKRPAGYFAPAADEVSMKRVRGEGREFLRLPVHVFGSITQIDNETFTAWSARVYESDKSGWLYFESEEFGNESNFSTGYCYKRWTDSRVYKVTARWGYAAVPLPVVEAVRLITARIYSVQKGTIGQVTAEGFINERLIPQAAKDLLKQFIRREFEL